MQSGTAFSVAKVGPYFHCIPALCVMENWMKKMHGIVEKKISHWYIVLRLCGPKSSVQSCNRSLLENIAPVLTIASLCVAL